MEGWAWRRSRAVRLGQLVLLTAVIAASTGGTAGPTTYRAPRSAAPSVASTRDTSAPATFGAALAFRGVSVIDVARGRVLPNQTVVVVDRWIRAVGPARSTHVPVGAQVIDARGKYLIPGLWDMEFYSDLEDFFGAKPGEIQQALLKLSIAHGVTGYRQLNSMRRGVTIDSMLEWRRKIAAGTWVGPRILIGTPRLEGVDSTAERSNPFSLATPAQARTMVDSLKATGADQIFVYNSFPMDRDVVFALLAEARRVRIPVGGHLLDAVTLSEASDSGMRSVDHLMGLENVCINFTLGQGHPPRRVDSTASLPECSSLAARLRKNHTWIAYGPSMVVLPSRMTDEAYRRRWQFLPKRMRPEVPDSVDYVESRSQYRGMIPKDAFTIADRAGVPLVMATDGPVGGDLHDLLAVAVEHGMRPLTALQAATLNVAEYLGGTDSLGTVQAGKLADLVLLNGNPLEDIYNTQRIQAVVANGRYFSRAGLDSLLQQTASAP